MRKKDFLKRKAYIFCETRTKVFQRNESRDLKILNIKVVTGCDLQLFWKVLESLELERRKFTYKHESGHL